MKKSILALAFAALLSACGQDVVTVGKLSINVSGLPDGSNPNLTVTGPSSFSKTLTASGTLENLIPGTYTITPAKIAVATDNYTAATASTSVVAGQTATSTVTYSKASPVEVTLTFSDFAGGDASSSSQGGKFVNYSYAGSGIATLATPQPVKTPTSLTTEYTLGAGNYGGVALGVNANASGAGVDINGNANVQPLDLSTYSKLRIKLARSGGGAVSIKIVGNDPTVQGNGCYPVYQATPGDDGGFAVTNTLSEYTIELSKFNYRGYCAAPDRKTIAETINNVVRVEIEDRFLPTTGSETRTLTLGSVVFVK